MKRILVVDDEKKIRRVYRSLLELEGFEILEAKNAATAREILKKESIDLILLDIKMPKVDGSVLYTIIQEFYKNVKVIIASIYPVDDQKRLVPEATDYYDKACGTKELLFKIKKALKMEDVKD